MLLKVLKCFFVFFFHSMHFSDQPVCFLCFFLCECFFLQGNGYCLVGAECSYKHWLVLQNSVGGKRLSLQPAYMGWGPWVSVCVSGVTVMQVGGDWHIHWGFRTCHQSWHQLGVSFECPQLGGAAKGVLGFPFLSYCPPSMGICGSIFPFPWAVGTDKFSYLVHPRPSLRVSPRAPKVSNPAGTLAKFF